MSALGVIPARYAATRFPGKPLALIAGVPMLQRVYEGARSARRLSDLIVATDDDRIEAACRSFGAPVVRTSPAHDSGTDRIAEAVAGLDAALVVNIQGDEPLIEGFVIDAAVEALEADPEAPVSTLAVPATPEEQRDPNAVKVVHDRAGRALYFSRSPIPYLRDASAGATPLLHVGLYAFRRGFLAELARLPRTPLERAEALEQLRVLEHGHAIRVAVVEGWRGIGVDVPADVARVEAHLRQLGRA